MVYSCHGLQICATAAASQLKILRSFQGQGMMPNHDLITSPGEGRFGGSGSVSAM